LIEVANLSKVDEDVMYKAYTLYIFIYELLIIKSIVYSNINPYNTEFIHNLTSNFGDFHIFFVWEDEFGDFCAFK